MTLEAFDVVVIGGANTDFLVRGPQLPKPNSTVEGEAFQQAPGGKGANQAVAAARLGARVALLARVGADERGRTLLAQLAEEQVDTRAIVRDGTEPTGVALVMVDEAGNKQIMTAPGANRGLTAAEIAAASELIASARVALFQLEIPLDAVAAGVQLARAAGAQVILDTAPPRALSEGLLRDLHVIRSNAAEAELLTGVHILDQRSAGKAASILTGRGAGSALVGAPGGDLLATSDEQLWFPHFPVQTVDATGAGDSLVAALAVRLARGDTLFSATRFASAAAALATTRIGAQAGLPRHEDVLALL